MTKHRERPTRDRPRAVHPTPRNARNERALRHGPPASAGERQDAVPDNEEETFYAQRKEAS